MTIFDKFNKTFYNDFLNKIDINKDKKVTIEEIRKEIDKNKDGEIENKEIESFIENNQSLMFGLLKKGFKNDELSTIVNSIGKAETSVELFEVVDKEWQVTENFKKIQKEKFHCLPVNKNTLKSRDINQVSLTKKGIFNIQEQEGNSCGTTSLSMIMRYFQGHTIENFVPTIDKYIRANGKLEFMLPTGKISEIEIDGYTSPRDIKNYANQNGMRAGIKNNSSLSDIKDMLDKGIPCLCLTDWNFENNNSTSVSGALPDGNNLHWVNVIGYKQKENPITKKMETVFIIANPHGYVQDVNEDDFDFVWRGIGKTGHLQKITGNNYIETGMKRLFIAMVPKNEETKILGLDGQVRQAGSIDIPDDSDGFMGKLSQFGSSILQKTSNFQDKLGNVGGELITDLIKGYDKNGIKGLIENLVTGDKDNIEILRKQALNGSVETKADIINELLNLGIVRSIHEDLIFEILKNTQWKDFNRLIQMIDIRLLGSKIESDIQMGTIMAWVAKSEIDNKGEVGPKFETLANYLSSKHRNKAIDEFLNNTYTKNENLVHKIPSSIIKDMIENLMDGHTSSSEETTIYELFRCSSWTQFEKIISKLDMEKVASELENDTQLADLTKWVIKSCIKTGNWDSLRQILNNLDTTGAYFRADDVIGKVVMDNYFTLDDLKNIPLDLRKKMKDLVDDVTRIRSDDAVNAEIILKNINKFQR